MFSENQFLTMLRMQDSLQVKTVGADWRDKNLDFASAIMGESAEANDHYGWKWWAKQNPNIEAAGIECVDVIHFALAGILQDFTPEDAWTELTSALQNIDPVIWAQLSQYTFSEWIKDTAITALTGNFGQSLYSALRAANSVGIDTNEVYKQYIGKNVLNGFRKENGYKEGTYIKAWDGKEDNDFLVETMNALDVNSATYVTDITAALQTKYAEVKAASTH